METTRLVSIKQAPDDQPNADGEWIEKNVRLTDLGDHGSMATFNRLTTYCDEGHHAVSYRLKDVETKG